MVLDKREQNSQCQKSRKKCLILWLWIQSLLMNSSSTHHMISGILRVVQLLRHAPFYFLKHLVSETSYHQLFRNSLLENIHILLNDSWYSVYSWHYVSVHGWLTLVSWNRRMQWACCKDPWMMDDPKRAFRSVSSSSSIWYFIP